MTPDSRAPRRYTDDEVRELLGRATDLESEGRSLTASTEGPTLAELEAVAAEAGIDPQALREAARELESAPHGSVVPSKEARGLLGAPLGVGLGALASVTFATAFPIAALGGSYLLSRRISAWFVRKRSDVLHRLMDEMVDLVESGDVHGGSDPLALHPGAPA